MKVEQYAKLPVHGEMLYYHFGLLLVCCECDGRMCTMYSIGCAGPIAMWSLT